MSNTLTIAQTLMGDITGLEIRSGMTAQEVVMANCRMNWESYFAKAGYFDTDDKHTDSFGATIENNVVNARWVTNESQRWVLRSDTRAPLGTVGPTFEPISNKNAFKIADSLGGEIIGCGEYEGGALAWMQVKLGMDAKRILGDDIVEPYLLIVTGHTGNRSLMYKLTPIRVWCKNTLHSAMKGKTKSSGRIRHSGDTGVKCTNATDLLESAGLFFNDVAGVFQSFAKKNVTQNTVERYFKAMANVKPQHYKFDEGKDRAVLTGRPATMYDRYMNAYHGNAGGADVIGVRGTLWGAYNAVTYVQDHDMVEEKRTGTKTKSANDRAAFQYFEASPRVSQEAFDTARDILIDKLPPEIVVTQNN